MATDGLAIRVEETPGSTEDRPEFELMAPDGYSFGGGSGNAHSIVFHGTREDAMLEAEAWRVDLAKCDAGCEGCES